MSINNAAALPALVIRRTFAASRERVFAAWTQADILARWFGPAGATVVAAAFDARVGGTYRIEMAYDGDTLVITGTVRELRAPDVLAFTWRWEEDDPADEYDSFVTIAFADRDGGTEITLTHEGLASAESRGRHEAGWTSTIDNLFALLAT